MSVAFKYLLKKIYKTKTRWPGTCLTFQEILNILIYGLGMGWALIAMKDSVDVPLGPSPLPEFIAPVLMPCRNDSTNLGMSYFGPMHTTLLFAPDTALTRAAVTAAAAALLVPIPGLPSAECQAVVGFETATDLLRAYVANGSHYQQSAAAAILFDAPVEALETNASSLGRYTLALSRERVSYKGESEMRDFFWPGRDSSRLAFLGYNDGPTDWLTSGFVAIQAAMDRAVATVALVPGADVDSLMEACSGVTQTIFPTPPYASTYNQNAGILEFLLPLFGTTPSLTLALLLGQFMIVEKGANLAEGLRMMGMTYLHYFGSWYLVYSVLAVSSAVLQTVGFVWMGYFPNSSVVYLGVTLVLGGLCVVPWAFFQVALAKPKTNDPEAAKQQFNPMSFGFMLLMIGGFALVHFLPTFPLTLKYVLGLAPPIALMQGVSLFVKSEVSAIGLTDLMFTADGTAPPLIAIWGLLILGASLCFAKSVHDSNHSLKRTPMPKADPKEPADDHVPSVSPPPSGLRAVVEMVNLGRAFAARPKPIVALAKLNLSMYEGQITALLGQNGAGKTTTIGMLTGLFPPSEGHATIYGHSTVDGMGAIRKLSGVCPQHDLVFEGLTCVENLALVGAQKGMSDEQMHSGVVEQMLSAVGLGEEKHHEKTGKLSGGQKRKLSLACALIGDPKFVLLDEPTAGMDPASRRTVWAVMAQSKPGRAIVLTTHFLDEADALGDRVAILHKGRLQCVGTTAELKEAHGTSYHLTISRAADGASSSVMLELARRSVPLAQLEAESTDEVALTLPQSSAAHFSSLFTSLDAEVSSLGVLAYGLSIPTLQEVFLKITADADQREAERAERSAQSASKTAKAVISVSDRDVDVALSEAGGAASAAEDGATALAPSPSHTIGDGAAVATAPDATAAGADASAGLAAALMDAAARPAATVMDEDSGAPPLMQTGMWQQLRMGMLLRKRVVFSDPLTSGFLFVFPGTVMILTFLLPPLLDKQVVDVNPDPTDPSTLPRMSLSTLGAFGAPFPLPFTPPAGAVQASLAALATVGGYVPRPLDSSSSLNATLKEKSYGAVGAYDIGVLASAGSYGAVNTTTILHNASLVSALPMALSLFDAACLAVASPGSTLSTIASLLPYTGESTVPLPTFYGMLITPAALTYIFMFFGMAIVIGLVKDRLIEKTTHQMMVMGLGPATRWLTDGIFWSLQMWFHLSLAILMVGIFHYYTPYAAALPAFAVCCLIAVPSIFCFLSLFNFLFWCRKNVEDIVAQTFCNVLTYTAFYPTLLISAIPVVRDTPLAKNIITFSLLLVPLNQISMGLTAIYTISMISAYKVALYDAPPATAADYFVLSIETPGIDGTSPGPLACMIYSVCTAPLWFFLLWYVDVRRYYYPTKRAVVRHDTPPSEDKDVAEERARVEEGRADSSLVRMLHLRREFRMPKKQGKKQPNKVAVADLSLAIDGRGCFALLGPNGAGKTTTLSMLTGDLEPTSGEGWIAGYSIRTQLMKIFSLLGYCPQFGGLFPRGLSLYGHLEAYARLKGVPEEQLAQHCNLTIAEFGLQEHAKKWATKLSGGTKRKLIAAVALACEPTVCFLDEPTTGVDVGTRLFLWERIRAKGQRGCALILTTHYMEEADTLAQRVGIMCNGRLRVLGSPQHLKSAHGGGYSVELKGPAETAEQAKAVVESLFSSVRPLEAHGGYQSFEVVGSNAASGSALFKLGPIFTALDKAKVELGLESYTLSQTTLEQVFLKIAAEQEDED